MQKLFNRVLVGAGIAALASPAFAVIDVSAAVTAITGDAVTAVIAVGTAMLTLYGVVVGFKWAKGSVIH